MWRVEFGACPATKWDETHRQAYSPFGKVVKSLRAVFFLSTKA